MIKSAKSKVGSSARASGSSHNVRSAAAALGGRLSAVTVQMPIINVLMDGDYTGLIYVGSNKLPINVILDTGSSTLAIDGTIYDPTKDQTAQLTDIAQEVAYADRSDWVGAVVLTDVAVGSDELEQRAENERAIGVLPRVKHLADGRASPHHASEPHGSVSAGGEPR